MVVGLDYLAQAPIVFLDATNQNGDEVSGVVTESNRDYSYVDTEYISDYKDQNIKNPLATEQQNTSLVLNETQKMISASTVLQNYHDHIQLTPEWWLSSKFDPESAREFNERMSNIRVIYEFEKNISANQQAILMDSNQIPLMPLNDILDVCVKDGFKKNYNNQNIPGNLVVFAKDNKMNNNIDIYLTFDEYPIEFCQCNCNAFVLSQPTTLQPYYLRSTIANPMSSSEKQSFELIQQPIETVLYKSPSEIKNANDDSLTYQSVLSSKELQFATDTNTAIDTFLPRVKLLDVDYNYIVEIDQIGNQSREFDNPTIYFNGDVYGSFSLAKNMYDPLYSMQMMKTTSTSDIRRYNTLSCCRSYCGIQNSQNKILLKYYDNATYKFDRANQVDGKVHPSTKSKSAAYPYQKVEYYYPNKMEVLAKHKSNLFSFKIQNSGLDADSASSIDKNVAEQIKRDISNGIRDLAEAIAPANTQLFKTYFI